MPRYRVALSKDVNWRGEVEIAEGQDIAAGIACFLDDLVGTPPISVYDQMNYVRIDDETEESE